jgi:hypothetical protein
MLSATLLRPRRPCPAHSLTDPETVLPLSLPVARIGYRCTARLPPLSVWAPLVHGWVGGAGDRDGQQGALLGPAARLTVLV